MRSKIAEQLRDEQIDAMRRLTPAERIALALELGERDLSFFMAVQKVDRRTALRGIRREHQTGRRYSACMNESLP